MNMYTWREASVRQHAHAKINTYLEVLARRADGYHDLCSHMQLTSLCDILDVAIRPCPGEALTIVLHCDHPELSVGEDNLIVRAARAFCRAAELPKEGATITFTLQKRIPMQGGLGGGSADAAAALIALNQLCDKPLTTEKLCTLGAALGADIPFCIHGYEGAMTARGIGERMTPAPGLSPDISLLIVLPGTAVSTPAAFRLLDERYTPQQIAARIEALSQHYDAHLRALTSGDVCALTNSSFNRFEEAVFALQPVTKDVFDLLHTLQADAVRMSGSGPTMVGYFADAAKAKAAQETLQCKGIVSYLCHPLV